MSPFSYTSIKVVHDQKIQKALEQQHRQAGQFTREPGLLHRLFARFSSQASQEQEELQPDDSWCVECQAS